MRKRIVALALAVAVMTSAPVSAFATSRFNTSVFDGRQDVSISSDDMTGESYIFLNGNSPSISFDNGLSLTVEPMIFLSDSYDCYNLYFSCIGTVPCGMTDIIIKIGDNRYQFSNCLVKRSSLDNGVLLEGISITMKRETVGFMNDLARHRDEEIKARINGTYTTLDFSLTDEIKNNILTFYALYNDGGGTRDENLRNITYVDSTSVYKNGKLIDGKIKEETIDALFYAMDKAMK